MRITIAQGPFLPVPPLLGGAIEKRFHRLGAYWASRGHQVTHISCAYPSLPQMEVQHGVTHLRVPSHSPSGNMLTDKFYDLLYAQRVRKALPVSDILITHTFFLPMLCRRPAQHGLVYVYVGRYPKGQLPLYSHVARLVVPSHAVYRAALSQAPFLKKKIHTIPNALPNFPGPMVVIPESLPHFPSQFQPQPQPCSPYRLMFAGRLHPEKGVHLLLQALSLLPDNLQKDVQLRIVGPHEKRAGGGGDRYLQELHALAQKTSASVTFVGPLYNPNDLGREYAQAHLFVYPSLADFGETFGVAPLEALSHGTPVLVSALKCFQDFVADVDNFDNPNGFVFNHRSHHPAQSLAETLQKALSQGPLWPTLSHNARTTASHFTLESIGDLFIKEFETTLAAHATRSRL